MKFVKGDAIAGIVITVINIVGGLVIGVVLRGMTAGDAFKVYALLTIGDGLVSQIPALLISTAAGLIVTRVASEEEGGHLGGDIGAQILAQPKAIALASGLLFVLALVPGLPKAPFFLLAAVTGLLAWSLLKQKPSATALPTVSGPAKPAPGTDMTWGVVPVALDLADDLFTRVGEGDASGGRFVQETIPELRRTLYGELGVVLPPLRVRRGSGLGSGTYVVRLSEIPICEGALPLDKRLAGDTPDRLELLGISGQAAVHPDGQAATWVKEQDAPALAQAGVPTWEPAGVLVLAVKATLRRHAFELLGIQETQSLLDALERTHPVLVREVVPKIVGPHLLSEVLRRLVEEGVSIRDLRTVLGALAEWGRAEKDPVLLTEYVRSALKRQITFQHTRGTKRLPVWLLDTTIEDAVRGAVVKTQTGSYLALEPDLSRDILQALRLTLGNRDKRAKPAVLITSMEIRRYVKRLVEVEHPDVTVLSHQELAPEVSLQPVGTIAVS
jgi:type III secretion protein V